MATKKTTEDVNGVNDPSVADDSAVVNQPTSETKTTENETEPSETVKAIATPNKATPVNTDDSKKQSKSTKTATKAENDTTKSELIMNEKDGDDKQKGELNSAGEPLCKKVSEKSALIAYNFF